MTVLRYDGRAMMWDAARGGTGLALTAGAPLLVADILTPIAIVCWVLAAIFAAFLARTALRHRTVIQVSEDGIGLAGPLRRRQILWTDLTAVRLSYFASAKTPTGNGVLSLSLKTGDTKIIVESSIKGFDRLAEIVAGKCARPSIEVDPTSMHNFDALGWPVRR